MNQISIEIEGRTVKEAIEAALKSLNLRRSQVDVVILSEGEKGLFGMPGGKSAKVRVSAKKFPERRG